MSAPHGEDDASEEKRVRRKALARPRVETIRQNLELRPDVAEINRMADEVTRRALGATNRRPRAKARKRNTYWPRDAQLHDEILITLKQSADMLSTGAVRMRLRDRIGTAPAMMTLQAALYELAAAGEVTPYDVPGKGPTGRVLKWISSDI